MKYKEFVLKLATYYREPVKLDNKTNIRLSVLEQYARQTFKSSDLDALFSRVISTFTPTQITPFPLVSTIERLVQPDIEAEARETAARIITAMAKYWKDSNYRLEQVKEYVGELGCEVIKKQGGWHFLLDSFKDTQTVQAQLRELAKSILIRGEKGQTEAPKLNTHRTGICLPIKEVLKLTDVGGDKNNLKNG